MILIHATYTPSGSIWQRFRHALGTAADNVRARLAERRPDEFYVQLDRLNIE